MSTSRMERIRSELLNKNQLYYDPDFEANIRSIYKTRNDDRILWKRPQEIHADAQFIIGGTSRLDVFQGSMGNCYYLSALAALTTREDLFERVIPKDQGFGDNYAGIFHFYFWRMGEWHEVIIDDRIPVWNGKYYVPDSPWEDKPSEFIFVRNREHENEFWPSLVEKAYAKFYGRYEDLNGGISSDSLVDVTGGVGHSHRIQRFDGNQREQMFHNMLRDYHWNTLIVCGKNYAPGNRVTAEGLVTQHAYSVTYVTQIKDRAGQTVRLVRLRNPHGYGEWNRDWSDTSAKWDTVSEKDKKLLRAYDKDGEFWISYEDLLKYFDNISECHLPLDDRKQEKKSWKKAEYKGEWVPGVTNGGSDRNRDLYWRNPQFAFTLTKPDDDATDGKCTFIASLMQNMTSTNYDDNVRMTVTIFMLRPNQPVLPAGSRYDESDMYARYTMRDAGNRELTFDYRFKPGTYVMMPSIEDTQRRRKFLLRIYSEQEASTEEIDEPTAPIGEEPNVDDGITQAEFTRYAGGDAVMQDTELRELLNTKFSADLGGRKKFELEACRTLISMYDSDSSGTLSYDDVTKMWKKLTQWRDVFDRHDRDDSDRLDFGELRSLFRSIGNTVSSRVLSAMATRYGGKRHRLAFNDFVLAASKLSIHMAIFQKHSNNGERSKAKFTREEYLMNSIYY